MASYPEPQNVQEFWSKFIAAEQIKPNLKKANFIYDFVGIQPKCCALYTIQDDREDCYIVSQEKLDELKIFQGTNHMKAMVSYLISRGILDLFNPPQFNYIVGFYYEVGKHECISCVNYFFTNNRIADKDIQEQFEQEIFPRIDDKFYKEITQCQGKVNSGGQCRRLMKGGFYCFQHRNQQTQ